MPEENIATEDQHFETVEDWKDAGSPAGTEDVSVTIGGDYDFDKGFCYTNAFTLCSLFGSI